MSKYVAITIHDGNETTFTIFNTEEEKYFAGYDFMGSVDWVDSLEESIELADIDGAQQIINDLESMDEPDDPVAKSLQGALDVARKNANNAFNAYWGYQKKDKFDIGGLDKARREYEKAQAYYEGVTVAIYAAGYDIKHQIDTDTLTVTK